MQYQNIWICKAFILLVPGMWNAYFTSAVTDVLSSHVLFRHNFRIHCSILRKWNSKSKHSFPETWVQILVRSQMKWVKQLSPTRWCTPCASCPTSLHRSEHTSTSPKVRSYVHREKRATNSTLSEKTVCNCKSNSKIKCDIKFQISWGMWKASIKITVVKH